MNKARKVAPTIGCLMIDDFTSGEQRLSGLCARMNRNGIRSEIFERNGRGELYDALQNAYYRVRSGCDIACILGVGMGIDAAIALSAQLPADRLVLIDRDSESICSLPVPVRSMHRIRKYAHRNIAFCTANTLMISDGSRMSRKRLDRIARSLEGVSCPWGIIHVSEENKMCTNGEHLPENQIYHFLCTGELPKSLAENPEMCIIYE